jgi:RimJ/RimL family protein N-acetyltransferase
MRDILRIETKRLLLRRLQIADGARVAHLTNDFDVARMTTRIPHPHFAVAAEGWILINLARASKSDHVFGVELSGEGLIGCIGAHGAAGEEVEIGYWFGKPYWGRGYASEALAAIVAEAQKIGPLVAGHFADNPASGRVLTKAGFTYTGETVPLFCLARGGIVATKRMRHELSFAAWDVEEAACA